MSATSRENQSSENRPGSGVLDDLLRGLAGRPVVLHFHNVTGPFHLTIHATSASRVVATIVFI
ncbi:hypothetical protein CVT26_011862 [Gymnopilus dilepis]|uniref:Uncharacterized protein n=1 Tax=Gymnopilus dilepis TaxID=231916 RepID=A0A409X0J8_9AGAR|nr:hypothetical protein CVT26_011862 [Gymnopilus dilepis]